MKTIERISKFKPELNKAYRNMILGINVQITDDFRKEWGKDKLGKWFFIKSLDKDERVTLVSLTHDIIEGATLNDIIL